MAKKAPSTKNPDRRNGKAWKKHPVKVRVKTPERFIKDLQIQQARDVRREENIAQAAYLKAQQEKLVAQKAAALAGITLLATV